VSPQWRKPIFAPLHALGISFIVVLLLGTVLLEPSTQPASKLTLLKITANPPPPPNPNDGTVRIEIKSNTPEDEPKKWVLPIPSNSHLQELLVSKTVCVMVPEGWDARGTVIDLEPPDQNLARCTKPINDHLPELPFEVSKKLG